jgi:hypothetical protein
MRSIEEIRRFHRLMQTLIWAKRTSGKSSQEVVNAIFRHRKKDFSNGKQANTSQNCS